MFLRPHHLAVALIALALAPATASAANHAPALTYAASSNTTLQTLTAGTSLVSGSQLDDASVAVTLPFPVTLYNHAYSSVQATTNGTIEFGGPYANAATTYTNTALPAAGFHRALFPYWDDLTTGGGPGEGIFTRTIGVAPSREFVIQWHAHRAGTLGTSTTNFEVRFSEGSPDVTFVYGDLDNKGATATIGMQQDNDAQAANLPLAFNTALGSTTFFDLHPFDSTIQGLLQVGSSAIANPAPFTGTPAPGRTYQWQRCDSSGANCVAIPGGEAGVYPLLDADVGHRLRYVVTAANGIAPAASATSQSSDIVIARPAPAPVYTAGPVAASWIPGTTDIGSAGDDIAMAIPLPFRVDVYGQGYLGAMASSNGSLEFGAVSDKGSNTEQCFPNDVGPDSIQALQSDLRTDGAGHGIFTAVSGTFPHRTFTVEWRAVYYTDLTKSVNFEIQLHEDSPVLTTLYRASAAGIANSAIGVAHGLGDPGTQFLCGKTPPATGTSVAYTPSRPAISGATELPTAKLAVAHATWSGTASLTDTWLRCDATGAGCVTTGVTGAAYTPGTADVGRTLVARESDAGGRVIDSPPSAVVQAAAVKPPKDRTKPRISGASLTPASFRAGVRVTLGLTLSEKATLTLRVQRASAGRRAGKRCAKSTHRNRTARRCTRLTLLRGSLTATLAAGRRSVRFTGRLRGTKLAPGAYRLLASAVDGAKNRGRTTTVRFRILAPPKPRRK